MTVFEIEFKKCPKCGIDCERPEVDIGIGIQYGPWSCPKCGWSQEKELREVINMEYKIKIDYIGGILTDNEYKIYKTRGTKPFVKMWSRELEDKVRVANIPQVGHYTIIINGFFTDERRPDISNLHKVIGDSIKKGLSVDDKYFSYKDGEVKLGYVDPYLEILIVPEETGL